ncbi:RDD family protein [Siminovitchia fortis]|uniref:RDD family protein n=1 Tax=Siminovitchia fortis TaxID=254758 RepID=A0A443IZ30_9BACI|nr:RDD family protein [Siminovitchia fortis]RWR13542.1 RDD family protein [Siminovitchia fortis]WHY81784.1 RDD family protein [Siminovitchia fortis]
MEKEQVGIKTPEFVSIQFQLAGLGSRAAAYLLDQFILTVANILVIIVLLILLTGGASISGLNDEITSIIFGIAIIGLFILNWGYFVFMEFYFGGKTIGKRALGIRVIQDNGHSLTLLSSFIRNFMRIVDSLPASYLTGLLMIFFHPQHKRVGDLVAGTIVVHERKAKRPGKLTPVEKEIQRRGLSKHDILIESFTLRALTAQDWNLVRTYSDRLLQLPLEERHDLTKQVAEILFPKLGWETTGKNTRELEDALLILYLNLKDEWEFEL